MLYKINSSQAVWSAGVSMPPKKPKITKITKNSKTRYVDYTQLLSRTIPSMSDEEFLEAATEQAHVDYANGVFQGPEMQALQNAFVSVVSPNRSEIVQRNYLRQAQHAQSQPQQYAQSQPQQYAQPQPQQYAENFYAYDNEGNAIAKYVHGYGWVEIYTPEEVRRKQIIMQAYNDAWMQLHRQAQMSESRFDIKPSDLGIGAYETRG